MSCQNLAVPAEVMQHVVNVESSRNPYAIGVVGGQLVRQPQNLGEAVATVRMLEQSGYNYSLGVAQVNRSNLGKYGLDSYEKAFDYCPNLTAGSQILAQCYASAGKDWGKAFSCYYSGNFTTGYEDGYVQRIFDSMAKSGMAAGARAIPLQAAKTPVKVVSVGKGVTGITTDSPTYRVAMRSVLDTAASAVIGPAVAAATGTNAPLQTFPADIPQTNVGNQPGHIRTDPTTAAVMSQIGISSNATGSGPAQPAQTTPSAAEPDGIYEPQVRGPNDAVPSKGMPTPAPQPGPRQDPADLRNGGSDGAFVF